MKALGRYSGSRRRYVLRQPGKIQLEAISRARIGWPRKNPCRASRKSPPAYRTQHLSARIRRGWAEVEPGLL